MLVLSKAYAMVLQVEDHKMVIATFPDVVEQSAMYASTKGVNHKTAAYTDVGRKEGYRRRMSKEEKKRLKYM